MCNFTDIRKQHPDPFYWWLTGYPFMTLHAGMWIRHLTITVVIPRENVSQTTIHIYGQHGGPFANLSEQRTPNDNGTITLMLTYSIPWDISRGNVTVDVIVGTSRYKKTFMMDRHSSDFYTTLAALLVLASIVLLAFILHRLRYGTDVPYTRNLE